jgi:hypothetical protein
MRLSFRRVVSVCLAARGDAGACVKGVFDPLADGVVLAVGTVQVDLMQDTGLFPARAATSAGAPLAFSHRDGAACRRS